MKNRHFLVCGPLLLRDLQALGYRLHDRLHIGLSLTAEDCLALSLTCCRS